MWKGDDASYTALHTWRRRYYEKQGRPVPTTTEETP